MILSVSAGYAQRVDVENGKVIINASDMPNTTTPKPNKTTATHTTSCTQDATDIASAVNNEKVYKKFEVSKVDSGASDWIGAVGICANLITDGGGWRLPTQRELMLMWVLRHQLERISGFVVFNVISYWSATERTLSESWGVNLYYGDTRGDSKLSFYRVRCVRGL